MQKVVNAKDDEEELTDSSTPTDLALESNVEHIKEVQEQLDTGVLDGAADESDRILGKKKGKKKMFKKNGNGKGAIVNPWVKSGSGSGSGSGSSSDTAMDLEEAKARIAELEAAQAEYDELQETRITFLKIALDECEGDNGDGTGVLNAVGQCNQNGVFGARNRDICRGQPWC